MPSTSSKQRTLFCVALSIKEGKTPAAYSKKAAEIAGKNSLETLRHYCKEPIAT